MRRSCRRLPHSARCSSFSGRLKVHRGTGATYVPGVAGSGLLGAGVVEGSGSEGSGVVGSGSEGLGVAGSGSEGLGVDGSLGCGCVGERCGSEGTSRRCGRCGCAGDGEGRDGCC